MICRFMYQYQFLSNFDATYPIRYKGISYHTAEHAFQAAKTMTAKDHERVRDCPSPGQAKRMGRLISLRPDWEEMKLEIMEDILRCKFNHPYYKEKLLQTHPHELVEGNHWGDTYWGVCDNEGQNHLGKLLMKIRKDIGGGV